MATGLVGTDLLLPSGGPGPWLGQLAQWLRGFCGLGCEGEVKRHSPTSERLFV